MIKESTIENTNLPSGWAIKNLPEISKDFDRKRVPITKSKRISGEVPYYGASGIVDYVKDFLFDEDLLLVSEDGANLLARTYPIAFSISGKTWVNNHAHILKFEEPTTQKFVELYLNSIKLDEFVSGMAQPKLNKTKLNSIPIPLPLIAEQKQIVSILDKAFAAIDRAKANAEQNLQNAKELFESYLQNVFENKGDDWEEKTLGEIGKVSMCKRILKKDTSPSGEIPFYKIGTFGKKPNAFISREKYEEFRSKYSFPKVGDVLLSASGTIGRRVIFDGKPGYFQDSNIVWIDNNGEIVLNEFLNEFYGYCDWNPSKGATISRLYNDDLRRIKISYPKSKEEQKQIVEKLDSLSAETKKLESIYTQKLADLEEMKKSILQKAFSGQLTTIN